VTVEAAIGDYALFSPCSSYIGKALDVKSELVVNKP
jgi:hypothetical protein